MLLICRLQLADWRDVESLRASTIEHAARGLAAADDIVPAYDFLAISDDPLLRNALDAGGEYAYRVRGEEHMWTPDSIAKLQHASRANSWSTYREYAALVNEQLSVVRPYIFSDERLIGWLKRMELKGKWAFDTEFQAKAALSLRQNEGRYVRWLKLLSVSLQHPELLATRHFRQRLLIGLSSGFQDIIHCLRF